ncbi:hypothetical protein [Pseudoalteromonas spongiae]|uniref:hypothetical protein n=1 Tax=Pseudoalteromonas spongiae TaxID=298657 RepID=UPI00026CDA0F|nr:hypothetical protein [Pseudoalteromonas spongiae]ATD01045.1 hypothetical protein PSPO_b1136 [Pseudoalteromonas spongiae UST010723-006]
MFDPDKLLQQRRLQAVTANVNSRLRETRRLEEELAQKLGMTFEQFKARCKKEREKGKTQHSDVKKMVSKVLNQTSKEVTASKPKKLPRHTHYI